MVRVPSVFRPLSVAAVYLRKRAIDLAQKTLRAAVVTEIHELFILRATSAGDTAVVTAIEIPALLGGPFGGLNAGGNYFLPNVSANYGAVLNSILKPSFKLEDGVPAPTLTDDPKFGVSLGEGRVPIGTLPTWGAPRSALNATVGQYYAYSSAILVSVCPTLDTGATPHVRSLLVLRTNAHTKSTPLTEVAPGADQPAVTGDLPTGTAERIGAIELSREVLGGTTDDLLVGAAACLEWGALRGVCSAALTSTVTTQTRLSLLGYAITDAGEGVEPRYVGGVDWQSDVSAATIPAGDAPQAVTATGEVAPGYTFPGWANTNGFPTGRVASDGAFSLVDPALTRMWAQSAGQVVTMPESTMMVLQVASGRTATNFEAEGWTGDPTAPVYGTFSIPAVQAIKYSTYVVSADTTGSISYTPLHQFTYAIYDPTWFGELARVVYRPYLGVNTFAGASRMVCVKRTHAYEIRAADADTPETPTTPRVQGELERKVLTQYDAYTRLSDLDYVLVASDGGETTIAVGTYYPPLFTPSTGAVGVAPAPTNGRLGYATDSLNAVEPRYAVDLPAPFCQYAPGVIAALLSPNTDYVSTAHSLRVGLFSAQTGALIALSPVLIGYLTTTRLTLTCFEQGEVDTDGVLLSHGRLLITASTLSAAPDRQDGVFAVSNLSTITWVSREPSNVPLYYLGNPLVPATIGVSTNLVGVKPTPIS